MHERELTVQFVFLSSWFRLRFRFIFCVVCFGNVVVSSVVVVVVVAVLLVLSAAAHRNRFVHKNVQTR